MPPRDRGDRSANPRWAPGHSRAVLGAGGLVGRTAATSGLLKEVAIANPTGRKSSERLGTKNVQTAKECLRLFKDIAERGVDCWDPAKVGYAHRDLTQVLLERTGSTDRVFEPVAPGELDGLKELFEELLFVNASSQDMAVSDLH